MNDVYVFYPSFITGGAEFLLKRTAELLSGYCNVTIVDYKGGWLSSNIDKKSRVAVRYIDRSKKIYLPDCSVLLTPASLMRNLDFYFGKSNAALLFWVIQPYNIVPFFPVLRGVQKHNAFVAAWLKSLFLKGEYSFYYKVLSLSIAAGSIYGMDDETNEVLKKYFSLEYSSYLPVAIDDGAFSSTGNEVFDFSEGYNQAVWLGRLDLEFKTHILKRVIDDLDAFAKDTGESVVFCIIGDGPGRQSILSYSSLKRNVAVKFVGELRGSLLDDEIKRSKLGFAMGTSAIELSARRLPTVLLDFSYKKVSSKYRYRWFFESSNYVLGRSIDRLSDESCGNTKSVNDLYSELDLRFQEISDACYDYSLKNHSSNELLKKLLEAVDKARFRMSDLYDLGVQNKPFWYALKKVLLKIHK